MEITLPILKVESIVYTPDFFEESLNLCDMTEAGHIFGEGDFSQFRYTISHIKKQWSNNGVGTLITLHVMHSEQILLTEPQIKEIILQNFSELYI